MYSCKNGKINVISFKHTDMKIDITSTVLEKAVDAAKDFLGKLINPTLEETGLLLKDQVTFIKFKNQVRILNKAKIYCEKYNISTKSISLKLLCPLLENAALEEDEYLQNKWAILLGNLVDSEQNIENHVFPYLLSQISIDEYTLVENVFNEKMQNRINARLELEKYIIDKPAVEMEFSNRIESIVSEIKQEKNGKYPYSKRYLELTDQREKFNQERSSFRNKEFTIRYNIRRPLVLPEGELLDFELANLIRLGIIKEVHETYADTQTLEIPNSQEDSYLNVKFDIDIQSNMEIIITELGEMFIKACSEKSCL